MAIDIRKRDIENVEIPYYITDNLAFVLRDYQKEALARFLYYNENKIYDKDDKELQKTPHLLWQMATGSGKTLIMAALILEMFKRGYRNFWYFVTSLDIITKTIDNFTNSASPKYQFAQNIEIDGRRIEITQVENFNMANNDCINIKFSTINILHQMADIKNISENSITPEDFENFPVVLIGDESHHLNASTKTEETENTTWENSVSLLLNKNPKNRLFEFTATANLTNEAIAKKYEDKLIYNYDLKKFREDGFSKDVFTFTTDDDFEVVILRSVLISEYRKHIASDEGIALKPVILFKSRFIAESKKNFDNFKILITNLTAKEIEAQLNTTYSESKDNDTIWQKVCAYFRGKEKSLVQEIQLDFDADSKKILLHDGKNANIQNKPRLLATLEDNNNPVRAIFAVNMLNEGWDVLNLFDIVRLYDTRDGKWQKDGIYKAGATTTAEAQLIGRGARYFPFEYDGFDKYKRKFDNNLNAPLVAIEQMHYHCKHNPQYISELHAALKKTGIIPDDKIAICKVEMKAEYADKNSDFQKKSVYENEIVSKDLFNNGDPMFIEKSELEAQDIHNLPDFENAEVINIEISSRTSEEEIVFNRGEADSSNTQRQNVNHTTQHYISEIPVNIVRAAINCNKNFTFENLKNSYPELKSISQFIRLFGKQKINTVLSKTTSNEIKFYIATVALKIIEPNIKHEKEKVYVTKNFVPFKVCDRFADNIEYKVNDSSKPDKLNTSTFDWFTYDVNYGTSDENSFVKWFSDEMMTKYSDGKTALEKNSWSNIYLVRNEEKSKKHVKLYSWYKENVGVGFEPDFVLFMTKNNIDYVFYIEVKGDWTYDKKFDKNFSQEQWKKNFLLEIESIVKAQQAQMCDKQNWRLIGLPFYNKEEKANFAKAFKDKLKQLLD